MAAQIGPSSLGLWLLGMVTFLIPAALTVLELSSRLPGEGGVYLWSKAAFGDLHQYRRTRTCKMAAECRCGGDVVRPRSRGTPRVLAGGRNWFRCNASRVGFGHGTAPRQCEPCPLCDQGHWRLRIVDRSRAGFLRSRRPPRTAQDRVAPKKKRQLCGFYLAILHPSRGLRRGGSSAHLFNRPPQAWISRFGLGVEIQHILQILQPLFVSRFKRHAQLKQLRRFETTGCRSSRVVHLETSPRSAMIRLSFSSFSTSSRS